MVLVGVKWKWSDCLWMSIHRLTGCLYVQCKATAGSWILNKFFRFLSSLGFSSFHFLWWLMLRSHIVLAIVICIFRLGSLSAGTYHITSLNFWLARQQTYGKTLTMSLILRTLMSESSPPSQTKCRKYNPRRESHWNWHLGYYAAE